MPGAKRGGKLFERSFNESSICWWFSGSCCPDRRLWPDRILILKGCARRRRRPALFAGLEPEHVDRSSFLLLLAVFADLIGFSGAKTHHLERRPSGAGPERRLMCLSELQRKQLLPAPFAGCCCPDGAYGRPRQFC